MARQEQQQQEFVKILQFSFCPIFIIYIFLATTAGPTTTPGDTCITGVSSPHSSCDNANSPYFTGFTSWTVSEALTSHNDYRQSVALSPTPNPTLGDLTWDDDLATTAQRYAAQCYYAHDDYSVRNVPSQGWTYVGQNLYASAGSTAAINAKTINDAVTSWFDEINDWVYGVGASPSGSVVGHFTQVVWQNTTHVGCAGAVCSQLDNTGWSGYDAYLFVVCNYGPA